MLKSELKSGVFLSCGVIVHGDVLISDVRRNIDKWALNSMSSNKYEQY